MFPKLPPVAFDLLDQGSVQDLTPASLDMAASAVLDALAAHPEGLSDVLRKLDDADLDALREGLWQTHLAPRIRRVPDPNPYADEEAHVLQEAATRLLRETLHRHAAAKGGALAVGSPLAVSPGTLLISLGDLHAIDLVVLIDDLRESLPSPG